MKRGSVLSIILAIVLLLGSFSCTGAETDAKAALRISPKAKTMNVGDELQLNVNTNPPIHTLG